MPVSLKGQRQGPTRRAVIPQSRNRVVVRQITDRPSTAEAVAVLEVERLPAVLAFKELHADKIAWNVYGRLSGEIIIASTHS
jgi:hypothetical protein